MTKRNIIPLHDKKKNSDSVRRYEREREKWRRGKISGPEIELVSFFLLAFLQRQLNESTYLPLDVPNIRDTPLSSRASMCARVRAHLQKGDENEMREERTRTRPDKRRG